MMNPQVIVQLFVHQDRLLPTKGKKIFEMEMLVTTQSDRIDSVSNENIDSVSAKIPKKQRNDPGKCTKITRLHVSESYCSVHEPNKFEIIEIENIDQNPRKIMIRFRLCKRLTRVPVGPFEFDAHFEHLDTPITVVSDKCYAFYHAIKLVGYQSLISHCLRDRRCQNSGNHESMHDLLNYTMLAHRQLRMVTRKVNEHETKRLADCRSLFTNLESFFKGLIAEGGVGHLWNKNYLQLCLSEDEIFALLFFQTMISDHGEIFFLFNYDLNQEYPVRVYYLVQPKQLMHFVVEASPGSRDFAHAFKVKLTMLIIPKSHENRIRFIDYSTQRALHLPMVCFPKLDEDNSDVEDDSTERDRNKRQIDPERFPKKRACT